MLHQRMKPPGTNIFGMIINIFSHLSDIFNSFIFKRYMNSFCPQQRNILEQQRIFGFGQYAAELLFSERVELNPNGKPSLKLRNQIRWLAHMKCAGSNE